MLSKQHLKFCLYFSENKDKVHLLINLLVLVGNKKKKIANILRVRVFLLQYNLYKCLQIYNIYSISNLTQWFKSLEKKKYFTLLRTVL